MSEPSAPVRASINGLNLAFDPETGGLREMSYAGPGTMLQADAASAGLVDLACPVPNFDPLRLATRFSRGADVRISTDSVTVRYDALGASRDWVKPGGRVGATITMRADADGRSVIMSCEVDNNSTLAVRQVIFPDFPSLLPFSGKAETTYRTCGFSRTPFLELEPNEDRLSTQFMSDTAAYSAEYRSGGIFHPMWTRWMDFGGLQGGFSIFPRQWGWEAATVMRLHHSETEANLRMLYVHNITIEAGKTWKSPEYVLTPHAQGWARGIEPYREWVREHVKRKFETPKRIREGIGYRTVWMSQSWPADPQDVIFKLSDLPEVARDSKEHGLVEMVMWGWHLGFELPIGPPFPHLGTQEDLVRAAEECRKLDVRLSPFYSCVLGGKEMAKRYGLQVSEAAGWTQHTETIPRWNPPYSSLYAAAQIGPSNPKWQAEALDSMKRLIDSGLTCVSWDQFWNQSEDNHMLALAEKIRSYQKEKDPEASLSGEELWSMEHDCELLDYTWNWGGWRDCKAFTAVFPAPRVNSCVSKSPVAAKRIFMDNLFLNVMPRKPGSVNGSGWIRDEAELSRALKTCAGLRKQFLPYFTEGTFIGECALSEPCPQAHVSGYVRPDRVLVLVMNDGPRRALDLKLDAAAWMDGSPRALTLQTYDETGRLLKERRVGSRNRNHRTPVLDTGEIAVLEYRAMPAAP